MTSVTDGVLRLSWQNYRGSARRSHTFALILRPDLQIDASFAVVFVRGDDLSLAHHRIAGALLAAHLEAQLAQKAVVSHPVRDHPYQRRLKKSRVDEKLLMASFAGERGIKVQWIPVLRAAYLEEKPARRYVEREAGQFIADRNIVPMNLCAPNVSCHFSVLQACGA